MSNNIQVTINETENTITLVLPLQQPTDSKSGKTLVIGSTYGNYSSPCIFKGKNVIVGANVYVKK